MVYISASRPSPPRQVRVLSPRVSTSSRTHLPPLTPSSSSQPLSRTRSHPISELTRTGLATPPPTATASWDPPRCEVTTQSQPADVQQQHNNVPPIPCSQFVTLIYPLLLETEMHSYFKAHDGVSRRTADRKFSLPISLAL